MIKFKCHKINSIENQHFSFLSDSIFLKKSKRIDRCDRAQNLLNSCLADATEPNLFNFNRMYICQTPDCSIALSKASFPVSMSCPVCQKPLIDEQPQSVISEEEVQLISSLPYLIAFPLENALKEEHAWTKINLLKDTFLNYLKFLGLLSASEFFYSPFKDKSIISSFYKNLAQPSFGSWNAFTRETLQFLNANNHSFFCPELVEYYENIESGKKRKLYQGEIEVIDALGDPQIKKQQATAIGMLINFRNRYLGHGLTLDTQTSRELWEQYYPIFFDLLKKMSWTSTYKMYKNEGRISWKLQGSEISKVDTLENSDSIWIQNKSGEKMDLIPFFILPGEVALSDEKTKVLAYESYTGKSIKFFSPEGIDKTTSGRILERLNILIENKEKEYPFSPEEFTKEIFQERIQKENQIVLQTLTDERKVISGIYQSREDIEIKLRSWIGSNTSIFFIAAEAGSGKTNLLLEIQRQYAKINLNTLLIRVCRMTHESLKEEICYLLNIENRLDQYCIAGTQNEPFFILLDGINESANEQKIWEEIKELSDVFLNGTVKFVVSCRVNTGNYLERFTIEEKDANIIYSENSTGTKGLIDAVEWLTPLSMKELEATWNLYVNLNKASTKPQFKFSDIALYDRALYEKIKNPLVLKVFLETYHNKPLSKKEKKKINIWRDWMASFSPEEKEFLQLLADQVWLADRNELELEKLISIDRLESFLLDPRINSPYARLVHKGWLSRYNVSNTLYISFTVEGMLIYLLGQKIGGDNELSINIVQNLLNRKSVLKKSAVESYLISCAENGEMSLISDLIDYNEGTLDIAIPALIEFSKSFGAEKMLSSLFESPTDLDWLALYKVVERLDELLLFDLVREIYNKSIDYNSCDSINQIKFALKNIRRVDQNSQQELLKKIKLNENIVLQDIDLIHYLSDLYSTEHDYKKAISYLQKYLNQIDENQDGVDLIEVYNTYLRLGNNILALLAFSNHKEDYDKYSFAEALGYFDKAIDGLTAIKGRTELMVNYKQTKCSAYGTISSKINFTKVSGFYYHDLSEFKKEDLILLRKELAQECIQLAVSNNLKVSYAALYSTMADYYVEKSEQDPELFQRAEKCYFDAIEITKKLYGSLHPELSDNYIRLAKFYHKLKDYQKALTNYQKAYEILSFIYGDEHYTHLELLQNIGKLKKDQGDAKDALFYLNRGLTIALTHNRDSQQISSIYEDISKIERDLLFNFESARNHLRQALDYTNYDNNTVQYGLLDFQYHVTDFMEIKHKIEKEKKYDESLIELRELLKRDFFATRERQGGINYFMGVCLENTNEIDRAYSFYLESAEIRKEFKGLNHEHTQKSIESLIHVAQKLDKMNQLPDWINDRPGLN